MTECHFESRSYFQRYELIFAFNWNLADQIKEFNDIYLLEKI